MEAELASPQSVVKVPHSVSKPFGILLIELEMALQPNAVEAKGSVSMKNPSSF